MKRSFSLRWIFAGTALRELHCESFRSEPVLTQTLSCFSG